MRLHEWFSVSNNANTECHKFVKSEFFCKFALSVLPQCRLYHIWFLILGMLPYITIILDYAS